MDQGRGEGPCQTPGSAGIPAEARLSCKVASLEEAELGGAWGWAPAAGKCPGPSSLVPSLLHWVGLQQLLLGAEC